MTDSDKPDFSRRLDAKEMMDDFTIVDYRLEAALEDLGVVNRWSGGHLASLMAVREVATRESSRSLRILDVGAGIGDYAQSFVRWGDRTGLEVEVVAIDANPATVDIARRSLEKRLLKKHQERIDVQVGDAFELAFRDDSFDVVHAGLFLHHFSDDEIVRILCEMTRVGRHIVINDLHRHPIAYHAVRLISRVFPVSEMFVHDGPISVLRAFSRADLDRLAHESGIHADIRWFPGFRWIVTARGA